MNSGHRSRKLCYAVTSDSQQPCQEAARVTDLSLSFVGSRLYQSLSHPFYMLDLDETKSSLIVAIIPNRSGHHIDFSCFITSELPGGRTG